MKHKIFAFLALLLTLTAACAGAQQRPSVGCFSPGLVRVSEKMKENPTVSADVTLTVENAFYARNLSVLKKMLEGTTLRVWGDDARGGLTLERGGETLMQADVAQDGRISVDGHPLETGISVPDEAQTDWNALAERLQTTPILERVPLTAVEAWLKGLKLGDVLGFGATAADAFDVKRTMSDDGERLTKLNVEGALTIGDETWTVSGYLRQPGGRAPKDTFELTFRKDDKKRRRAGLQRAASGQDRAERPEGPNERRHDAQGQRQAGGLFGLYDAKVNQRNDWTADGETLNEKITVSVNMTQKDNRPGKNMQGLNRIDAEGKNVIRVTTGEATADALDCELTGKLMLNENTFLQGGASMRVTIGGEAPDGAQADSDAEPWTLEEAVRALSRRLYRQLDEQTKKSISDGL
ncbi:MAG: hypothetical protein ACLVB5_12205 [Christensenellales bacterium]